MPDNQGQQGMPRDPHSDRMGEWTTRRASAQAERKRMGGVLLTMLDREWRSLREVGEAIGVSSRDLIGPARDLKRVGLVESEFTPCRSNLLWRRTLSKGTPDA